MQNKYRKAKILIADDDRATLALLTQRLTRLGYDCMGINDSTQVLAAAETTLPDLFLLDLMMPELDGIELCKRIKAISRFAEIPIIFVTAADDPAQVVKAFDVGAVDYVTKPINMKEIGARVRTHVELNRARVELAAYTHSLERLARERAEQLIHADRLATLGTLSASVAHEINNPAAFVSGNLQMVERYWDSIARALEKAQVDEAEEREKLAYIVKEMPEILSDMKMGVRRITDYVSNLKSFARKEGPRRAPLKIEECLNNALELCRKSLVSHRMEIALEHDQDLSMTVYGDAQQIEQVFVNLILNAADAAEGVHDARLTIALACEEKRAKIVVQDNGPGIRQDLIERIWDPFFTTKPEGKGTGLGLSIVRSIVEGHDGQIRVGCARGGGARFELTLPMMDEDGENDEGSEKMA